MLARDLELEDLKCELDHEEEEYIWRKKYDQYDRLVSKKLDILRISDLLMKHYLFYTIGDKIKDIYYYEDGIFNSNGYDFIRERVQNYTRGNITNHDVTEIIGQIERSTLFSRAKFSNTPENLICFNNCIYDLDKDETMPHSAKFIFTHKIPHNFNKEAKCENINSFLNQVLNTKDIETLQEFVGYLMYRRYMFKKAMIFVGEPDTGKTTTINLIIKLIGEKNTSGESLHSIISDKFAAINLYNKHLNFYDDLPFQDLKVTGQFKVVTGGGYISGEKKFGDRFQFMNYAKLLYATNKISGIKDVDDDAYYNRWLILFFNNVFEKDKKDPTILDKITSKEELEGFVQWALIGLKRLLINKIFSHDRNAEETRSIMEKNSNIINAFIQDCLERDENSAISKEQLYNIYSYYVEFNNGSRVTKEKFGRDIQTKLTYISNRKITIDGKQVTAWGNLGLKKDTNHTFLKTMRNKKVYYNVYDLKNTMISLQDYKDNDLGELEEEEVK